MQARDFFLADNDLYLAVAYARNLHARNAFDGLQLTLHIFRKCGKLRGWEVCAYRYELYRLVDEIHLGHDWGLCLRGKVGHGLVHLILQFLYRLLDVRRCIEFRYDDGDTLPRRRRQLAQVGKVGELLLQFVGHQTLHILRGGSWQNDGHTAYRYLHFRRRLLGHHEHRRRTDDGKRGNDKDGELALLYEKFPERQHTRLVSSRGGSASGGHLNCFAFPQTPRIHDDAHIGCKSAGYYDPFAEESAECHFVRYEHIGIHGENDAALRFDLDGRYRYRNAVGATRHGTCT